MRPAGPRRNDVAAALAILRGAERGGRAPHQRVCALAVARPRDSRAGGQEDLPSADVERLAECVDRTPCERVDRLLGGLHVLADDRELVATQPADGVARPHHTDQPLSDRPE